MVADGHPVELPEDIEHIVLPVSHGDYGDTPRCIGTMAAYSQGFDAVCWLDADNWLEPKHVETMVDIVIEHGVSVVTAARNLYWPDGEFLAVCEESNGVVFNDTNCYFITRKAMPLATTWVFKDKALSVVGDRVLFERVRAEFPARFHSRTPTVNYESCVAAHYIERGLEPPKEARIIFRNGPTGSFHSMLYSEFVEAQKNG